MLRRLLLPLLGAMLASAFLAPTAFASNPTDPDGNPDTTNLAGRPINGYSYDTAGAPFQWYNPCPMASPCFGYYATYGTGHGIAYGKVNGQIVLFYPWHARADASYPGKYVFGPNGSKIGTFGPNDCYGTDCASAHDMSYIILYQGNWPANLNRIYRGTQSGGANPYWTITQPANVNLDCPSLYAGSAYGDVLAQNWQKDPTTFWSYRTGSMVAMYTYGTSPDHCTVMTSLQWHNYPTVSCPPNPAIDCQYRDAGSPWVDTAYPNTIFGITSLRDVSSEDFVVTPIYEGIKVLYHHWQDLGSTAYWCKSADCST